MKRDRWNEIEPLLHAALERKPEQRGVYLQSACGEDEFLRQEVERLLAYEDQTHSFIETPALELVARQEGPPRERGPAFRLAIGAQLGPYEILKPLGAGGMGEIYSARDARLGRTVALKILAGHILDRPGVLCHLQSEARAISSLNHSNICTLYDIGRDQDIDYLVMEFVEGQTLAKRLKEGPLSVRDAMRIATEIAEALDYAHRHGVIHRDLKPGNIMLTERGAKLVDFGLAILSAIPRSGKVEATSIRATTAEPLVSFGTAVGTVAYMSPEQARDEELDTRTDLWSFGAVLYEMTTGARPFTGITPAAVCDAILHDPPLSPLEVNPELPPKLEVIVNKALAKNRNQRYQDASEIRSDLQQVSRELDPGKSPPEAAVPVVPTRGRRLIWLAAAALLLVVTAAFVFLLRRDQPTEASMRIRPLTNYPGGQYEPAFSPDGREVAFVWDGEKQDNFDIYVKSVEGAGGPLRITTNPAGEGSPAWSPDGKRLAFVRYSTTPGESGFYIVPAHGGAERRIGRATPVPHIFDRHVDWSPDGRFLAVSDKADLGSPFEIFLLSIETGERRRITTASAASIGDTGPMFSPDGRTLAFRHSISASINDIYVVPVAGGEMKRLTFDNGYTANHAWTPDGRELIFSSSRAGTLKSLWRVPASGGAAKEIRSVGQGAYYIAVSRRGRYLAYSRWFADTNIWRMAIAPGDKKAAVPEEVISSTWEDRSPQYSPDGTKIAFRSDRSGNNEIWVCDASGSNPRQLTSFGGPLTGTPRWSPDGKYLAFDSRPAANSVIYTIPVLGGEPRRITALDSDGAVPSWSHNGKWIYFASTRPRGLQVWKVPVEGGSKGGDPVQVTQLGGFAAFESTDGTWLYYAKGYDVPGLWVVSVNGGDESPLIADLKVGFWGYWAVVARGIYFLAPLAPRRASVNFYNFESHAIGRIGVLPQEPPFSDSGFAVSPDERSILYSQVDHTGSDIMLVEGFR